MSLPSQKVVMLKLFLVLKEIKEIKKGVQRIMV